MMLVLKIPILYLCAVVWWAIKSEPRPFEAAAITVPNEPVGGPEQFQARVPQRRGPRRGPARRPVRTPRTSVARAEARR
jgi:hypothetical protein